MISGENIILSNNAEYTLECPSCGCDYLHHYKIESFERDDDEETGVHVSVKGKSVSVDTDMRRNPSKRRHGMMIYFFCEYCTTKPVIELIQHKGRTHLTMKY